MKYHGITLKDGDVISYPHRLIGDGITVYTETVVDGDYPSHALKKLSDWQIKEFKVLRNIYDPEYKKECEENNRKFWDIIEKFQMLSEKQESYSLFEEFDKRMEEAYQIAIENDWIKVVENQQQVIE